MGKTVLLKEYRKAARAKRWIVVRRDVTPRLNQEADFVLAITTDLGSVITELSLVAKLGKLVNAAREAVTAVIDLGEGVTVKVGVGKAGERRDPRGSPSRRFVPGR